MEIGIIGTGVIASAVVRGLAGHGHLITVSERSTAQSRMLEAEIAEVRVMSNQEVLEHSDVIFLGLMGDVAPAVLDPLKFRQGQRIISLMGGVSLKMVSAMVQPAQAVSVMIPFPAIAQGGSPVLVQGDVALIEALFGDRNEIFALNGDEELNAYLCAQAVLSPAVRLVQDAAIWLGKRVADDAQAEAFLRHLVGSSLLASETDPLLQALNTPGGYNARLREHMAVSGMSTDVVAGLDDLEK
ncbi:MAG: NAD(P)-binding domain-containing protein [Paracoccaceae bacterium]